MDNPFNDHAARYDAWFDHHADVYQAELGVLRKLLPPFQDALEIGVGTGRFAKPLRIKLGIEPSSAMATLARTRGIKVLDGVAESLPFPADRFDLALMVTTICFVAKPAMALAEAHRVLRPGGRLVLGFVDKDSVLGKKYIVSRNKSPFYRNACFFGESDIADLLISEGFVIEMIRRLRLAERMPEEAVTDIPGDFTVIRACAHASSPS